MEIEEDRFQKDSKLDLIIKGFNRNLSLYEIAELSDLPESWVVGRLKELSELYPKLFPEDRVREYQSECLSVADTRIRIAFSKYVNRK